MLLDTFGTHFIYKATFGQFLQNRFLVSKDFHLSSSDDELLQLSVKSFMNKYWRVARPRTSRGEIKPPLDVDESFLSATRIQEATNSGNVRQFENSLSSSDFIEKKT